MREDIKVFTERGKLLLPLCGYFLGLLQFLYNLRRFYSRKPLTDWAVTLHKATVNHNIFKVSITKHAGKLLFVLYLPLDISGLHFIL